MSVRLTGAEQYIADNIMPNLADNVYGNSDSGVIKIIYNKAKRYNDNRIVIPIKKNSIAQTKFISELEAIALRKKELTVSAEWQPKMFADSILLSEEEMLTATSPRAALNIVTEKMADLAEGMRRSFDAEMYVRPNASTGILANTKSWDTLPYLVNDVAGKAVGGITPNVDFARWTSTVKTASDFSSETGGGDITDVADLVDPAKTTYLPHIMQWGIRMTSWAASATGKGIYCVLPQILFDILEDILDPQKTGSALDEMMGQMGFRALKYRDMIILPDDQIVRAQGGTDNTGEIYFLNLNYIDMFFHPNAMFSSKPFVQGENVLAASKLFYSYGNMTIKNRRAQAKITGVYSPADAVELGVVNDME